MTTHTLNILRLPLSITMENQPHLSEEEVRQWLKDLSAPTISLTLRSKNNGIRGFAWHIIPVSLSSLEELQRISRWYKYDLGLYKYHPRSHLYHFIALIEDCGWSFQSGSKYGDYFFKRSSTTTFEAEC